MGSIGTNDNGSGYVIPPGMAKYITQLKRDNISQAARIAELKAALEKAKEEMFELRGPDGEPLDENSAPIRDIDTALENTAKAEKEEK